MKNSLFTTTLISLSLIALPALAQIDGNLDISVSSDTTTGVTTTSTTTNADIIIDTPVLKTTESISNTSLEVSRDNDSRGKTTVNISSDTIMNGSGQNAIMSSAQVNTDADLKLFAESMLSSNTNVSEIEADSDNSTSGELESSVSVGYRHQAKLLGFIPVTMESTTIVSAEDNNTVSVYVRLPWWSFLTSSKSVATTELEASLESNPSIQANAIVTASAKSKAQLIELIVAELDNHTRAQASIE